MRPYVWFQAEVVDMDREVQFLLYNMPEDSGKVQVVIKDETIWCTQKAMAQLFGVGVPAVSKHLKNIFDEGELSPEMTISKMETVINRGKRGEVNEFIDFYNLMPSQPLVTVFLLLKPLVSVNGQQRFSMNISAKASQWTTNV